MRRRTLPDITLPFLQIQESRFTGGAVSANAAIAGSAIVIRMTVKTNG